MSEHQQLSKLQANGPCCDMCYAPRIDWDAQMRSRHTDGTLQWHFSICDSCRLIIRNVLGVVLHGVPHTAVVAALVQLLAQRGITFEDLMQPLRELKALEE